jgi:hypothetical protein
MAWVRVDDNLHAHPKFRAAWEMDPAAVGLELLALSYAAAYLTDGEIDDLFVRTWLRSAKRRTRAIDALVDAHLWVPNGSGWQIHHYLEYNDSREEIEQRRRADAARKRGARRVSS